MNPITNFENRMRIVFGLAFAVLLSTVAISVFVISRLYDNSDWVSHTHEVIAEINSANVHFGDARVSTKNYLLTRQARHLAPRVSAFQEIDSGMAMLKSMTHDNPAQQEMCNKTMTALAEYQQLTAKIISEVDNGEGASLEQFDSWTDRTEASGSKVGSCFNWMRQEEKRLLKLREYQANSFVTQAYSIMPFMLAVQLVITTYIYYGVLNHRNPNLS